MSKKPDNSSKSSYYNKKPFNDGLARALERLKRPIIPSNPPKAPEPQPTQKQPA